MVFINKLSDHSHHDDLRVDDELVVQNLKLPTNATVTGLTVNHIQGLSDSLGNLTIDESALLADVNTQIAGKADASSVYTQTELDTIHATFAPASIAPCEKPPIPQNKSITAIGFIEYPPKLIKLFHLYHLTNIDGLICYRLQA